jgi:hypothetical protein
MSDPTTPEPASFDFTAFAQKIYCDSPEIYLVPPAIEKEERFLLPALYGGEVGDGDSRGRFEALIVLEAPSISFTKAAWNRYWTKQCASPEEAISRHREIFSGGRSGDHKPTYSAALSVSHQPAEISLHGYTLRTSGRTRPSPAIGNDGTPSMSATGDRNSRSK